MWGVSQKPTCRRAVIVQGPPSHSALQCPADGCEQNFNFLLTWYQKYYFHSDVKSENRCNLKDSRKPFMSGDNIPIILIIIACRCLANASFIVLPLLEMGIKQLTA